MFDYIYYTIEVAEDLKLHLWASSKYYAYSYLTHPKQFKQELYNLLDSDDYLISYRGGHHEKPLIVAFQALENVTDKQILIQKLKELNNEEGAPTARLSRVFKDLNIETDYYQTYLELLTRENWLDIETFDGRIYHNEFQRLELQAQLPIAQTKLDYLKHLEIIFQSEVFQEVYREKKWLLATFPKDFHIPVNATTTDAQLTESFYTKGKLLDARQVFIPQPYLSFRYFLRGDLEKLFQIYQLPNPKIGIKKAFGQKGAVTQAGDFVILSAASAPIGFRIENFNKDKPWSSQVKTISCNQAIRLDFTHIQSRILQGAVKDWYFQRQLKKVLQAWDNHPEYRKALNRLLYPIQGTMDTPFEQDLRAPNYAYSMRLTHNLLLIGLLQTLVADGFKPISLNNEVLFFEKEGFNKELFEKRANVLGVPYDIRLVSNLMIKDTNNYTYFDELSQEYVFRGASFNHYQGTDLATNMDTPAIVDYVLKEMISRFGKFSLSKIRFLLEDFLQTQSEAKIKEFFTIPIYPMKNRCDYLYRGEMCEKVVSPKALFASKASVSWQLFPIYFSKKIERDIEIQAFCQRYQIELPKNAHKLKTRSLKAEMIDDIQLDKIDLSYYQDLIETEISLWS